MDYILMLTELIEYEIREEFKFWGMSGNLLNNLRVEYNGEGFELIIPAQTYDASKWADKKVVVHNYQGSYASLVNEVGKHKGFMQRCVNKAIQKYNERLQIFGLVVTKKDGENDTGEIY